MTFPVGRPIGRRGTGSRQLAILLGIRIWETRGTSPIGNVVLVQNPAHLAMLTAHPFGSKGGKSLLWLKVTDVPDDIAWVTDFGQLNGVDSVLVWAADTTTRRYKIDTAALRSLRSLPTWTAAIDRGLDPSQATLVADIPTLSWAEFRPLLRDKEEGLRNAVTDTELKTREVPDAMRPRN